MNEFACVSAAVIFCPMYSCYTLVFLSWLHTNTNCAAFLNITGCDCLSEWRSLCHKYLIMPLGIYTATQDSLTNTLVWLQRIKVSLSGWTAKAFCLMSNGLMEVFCCLLSWCRLALCYILKLLTLFLIYHANWLAITCWEDHWKYMHVVTFLQTDIALHLAHFDWNVQLVAQKVDSVLPRTDERESGLVYYIGCSYISRQCENNVWWVALKGQSPHEIKMYKSFNGYYSMYYSMYYKWFNRAHYYFFLIMCRYLYLKLTLETTSLLWWSVYLREDGTCHSHQITAIANHNPTIQSVPDGQTQVPKLLVWEVVSMGYNNMEGKTIATSVLWQFFNIYHGNLGCLP